MRVYVKIPITSCRLEAAKTLIEENIPITFTACYAAKQVLIAAAIGASYIAPYMGRINDLGINGAKEIVTMKKILLGLDCNCKLLVASIRNTKDLVYLSSNGLQVFTINQGIAKKLIASKESDNAAKEFEHKAKDN